MATMPLESLADHDYIKMQLRASFSHLPLAKRNDILARFQENFLILVLDERVAKAIRGADNFSIMKSLMDITRDGLSINPHDHEACIVSYNGVATAIPMAYGKLKKMQDNKIISRIDYLEIIYVGDEYSNNNGKWKHSINLERPDNAKKLGVLIRILMPDRTKKTKFCTAKDILKRKATSPMAEIWEAWEDEMWKKTAINMFEKEIGRKAKFDFVAESEEDVVQRAKEDYSEEENTEDIDHEEVDGEELIKNSEYQAPEPIIQDTELRKTLNELIDEKILQPDNEKKLLEIISDLDDKGLVRWIAALQKIKTDRQNTPSKQEDATKEEPMI